MYNYSSRSSEVSGTGTTSSIHRSWVEELASQIVRLAARTEPDYFVTSASEGLDASRKRAVADCPSTARC